MAVKKIIAKYTGYECEEITNDMELEKDLGCDSITRYEISTAVEAVFELEDIPIDEITGAVTVQDIIDIVKKYTLAI